MLPARTLSDSGTTPIPSGRMRINSSSVPGRRVGFTMPTTPRQSVKLITFPRISSRANRSLIDLQPDGLDDIVPFLGIRLHLRSHLLGRTDNNLHPHFLEHGSELRVARGLFQL